MLARCTSVSQKDMREGLHKTKSVAQHFLNREQLKNSKMMENFNMLVLHTITWRWKWYHKRWNMWVHPINIRYGKGKVKCTHVQALSLCTGCMAHSGSRSIAVLFHDHGSRKAEGSASCPGPSLPPGKTQYPLYRRLGWPQG
jgi:hypothetical protein